MKIWQNKISRIVSNPLFGILGWAVAMLATVAAFYFYFETKSTPHLSYYVDPVRAIVLRAERPSNLTIDYDNKPIETDLTAVQIVFWNAGKQAIKKENILERV